MSFHRIYHLHLSLNQHLCIHLINVLVPNLDVINYQNPQRERMHLQDALARLWRTCHVTCHVNWQVIIAIHVIAKSIATSSSMSSMCDMAIESVTKIILIMTFIFVIENGLGLDFGGPETFCDGFKTSWIKQFMTKF